MAGKFSIYKYVKLAGRGWRYARAAYHPNGKIKPDAVLVKGVNGKNVEEKHPEGSYFLNFNNTWIPVRGDALEAQHQRKLKLNQVEYERLRGKTAQPGPNLVQFEFPSLTGTERSMKFCDSNCSCFPTDVSRELLGF